MGLRLAYNTNGFAHHTLDDCLRILADLGYDGVALTLDVHHLDPRSSSPRGLDDLAARLDRLGLRRTVETGARFLLDPLRKHEPSLLAEDGWERRMRFLEHSIEIASEIGAPVVTFSSGSADKSVPARELRARLAERCAGLAESASRKGVRLGFEPEPGMFVGDLAGYVDLRRDVEHEALGLTLDIGHVHLTEDRPPAEVVRAFSDALLHVHLEDMRRPEHRHLAIGEGEIDFPPVLDALEEIGFDGLVALELSRDSHRAPEVARSAIAAIRGARTG
jgi:sugar phosphate isomerase/epimerase